MDERYLRTVGLIGKSGLQTLSDATVAVFGIGGVGSYAVEGLVRSGVGTLYIYDNDTVAPSNINRQLVAMESTIGKYKTEVAAMHCKDINPEGVIIENRVFVTPETPIDFSHFDYIIDAVDNVTAKLFLIEGAQKAGVPIISVMGTGNKLDPTQLQIGDIYKTRMCPLARVMRCELKKRGIRKLPVVWSPEPVLMPDDCGEQRATGRPVPGSMAFVPGCAGLIAASAVVRDLIAVKETSGSSNIQ